jgi:glycine cleavage system H protein
VSALPDFVHRGCELPDGLLYAVDLDVWVRLEDDGTAALGMTDPAQSQCGKIVHVRFKPAGRSVKRLQSVATIESAKWVGPFPSPLSATIVATNEEGFRRDILVANKDPYGAGWLARIRPDALDAERGALLAGEHARDAYVRRIEERGITCMRCAEGE